MIALKGIGDFVTKLFFSLDGRIGRLQYWLSIIGIYVLFAVGPILLTPLVGYKAAVLVLYALSLYPIICIYSKRLHDRNKPALPLALLFVGVAAVYSFLVQFEIGFTKIQVGPDALVPVPIGFAWLSQIIVLIVGIWAIFECGIKKGTDGGNRFGNDPLLPKSPPELTGSPENVDTEDHRFESVSKKGMIYNNLELWTLTVGILIIIPAVNFFSIPRYEETDDWDLISEVCGDSIFDMDQAVRILQSKSWVRVGVKRSKELKLMNREFILSRGKRAELVVSLKKDQLFYLIQYQYQPKSKDLPKLNSHTCVYITDQGGVDFENTIKNVEQRFINVRDTVRKVKANYHDYYRTLGVIKKNLVQEKAFSQVRITNYPYGRPGSGATLKVTISATSQISAH